MALNNKYTARTVVPHSQIQKVLQQLSACSGALEGHS